VGRQGAYTPCVERETGLRERFATERRRSAFFAALAGMGAGIIAIDTWVAPQLGVVGGISGGLLAYALVFGYETLMWRRSHGA